MYNFIFYNYHCGRLMNAYQILMKNGVYVAVNLMEETASTEISTLSKQGFNIHSDVIEATTKELALDIFKANISPSTKRVEFSIKSALLFKTNGLQRLPYLGYSVLCFVLVIVALFVLFAGIDSLAEGFLVLLAVVSFFILTWFGLSLSVARWKNCGNKGWYYAIALIITLVLDTLLMGVAGFVLWLYLLFNPQDSSIENT
ncbi:hypothetical protein LRP52_43135 [Photobacterium sp. ZSDE20]|uniref:DUF805 domain-containing protein n=1 Tax=Photobacterium pectinilyticum TaxID=2906793 RepID=A0ABT1N4C6_9GAMM|nr:hypothetical protein [Photobacterium sp. ZSDE20]MCQ1059598.1 hypothetical protein [Photobacterium sp. ZSDE20]MDD1828967.1 hypothetical protein [Photobacterium sp. ZSDE20]